MLLRDLSRHEISARYNQNNDRCAIMFDGHDLFNFKDEKCSPFLYLIDFFLEVFSCIH